MKTPRLIALTLLATLGSLRAQGGSLTPPPGAPAPVMRSLTEIYDKATAVETQNTNQNTQLGTLVTNSTAQGTQLSNIQTKLNAVETRTAVNSLAGDADSAHLISQPGSYYLTGNITVLSAKNGIKITASDVTLDLNGFTVSGTTAALSGITSPYLSVSNITILNGKMTGWLNDNKYAIELFGRDAHVENIHISSCYNGIIAGQGARVIRCNISMIMGKFGIFLNAFATLVSDCVVHDMTSTVASGTSTYGIKATTVTRCHVYDAQSSGDGMIGIDAEQVTDCYVKEINSSAGGFLSTYYIIGDYVSGCFVEQATLPTGNAYQTIGISGNVVTNCIINKLQSNANGYVKGILGSRVTNCSVKAVNSSAGANVIGVEGIWLPGQPDGTTQETALNISGCSISGIKGRGISCLGSGCCLIENNVLQSCVGTNGIGIKVDNAIVRNNMTYGCETGIATTRGTATGNASYGDTTAFTFGASTRYGTIVTGGGAGGFDATSNIDQ